MISFTPTFKWVRYSSTLTNYNAKLLEKIVLYMFSVLSTTYSTFIIVITKKNNFIDNTKKRRNFFAQNFCQIETFWG